MIGPLTEGLRSVESACRAWAADATRGMREASGLSAEDFGGVVGVGESRQLAFERQDEGRTKGPRIQLDKLVRAPLPSLLALCRSLLGDRAVVVEVTASTVALGDAGRVLTKEGADAVLASLAAAQTPEALATLSREARELATYAIGVALAADAERERLTTRVREPLRAAGDKR